MTTFVKYPVTEIGLKVLKCDKYFVVDKIESKNGFIIVYPKFEIVQNKVVYSEENKIGFHCKTMNWKDILKFKGGFNIEKCSQKEWQKVGKKWYIENKIKLPRKLKKKIIGKIK